jgi:hypothetical protein
MEHPMAKASTSIFRITSFAVQTRFIGIALAALVLTGSAYADAVFIEGNSGGNNIVGIGCCTGDDSQPAGMPLTGYVSNRRDVGLEVLSLANGLTATAAGSTISGAVTGVPMRERINEISIIPCLATACFGFHEIRFTLVKPVGSDISVEVFTCVPGTGRDGSCGESEAFKVVDQGRPETDVNLSIVGENKQVIWHVEILSPDSFMQLKNTRFSAGPGDIVRLDENEEMERVPDPERPTNGPTVNDVIPEPSSILLLGSAMLGLAQVLRRKLS